MSKLKMTLCYPCSQSLLSVHKRIQTYRKNRSLVFICLKTVNNIRISGIHMRKTNFTTLYRRSLTFAVSRVRDLFTTFEIPFSNGEPSLFVSRFLITILNLFHCIFRADIRPFIYLFIYFCTSISLQINQ